MSVAMFLRRLVRRIWFRAALFTVAALLLALAARLVGLWLPFSPSIDLGQNSVDSLLQIIASSMLAVTTFSLTAMVTAYSAATTTATPRATQLLVEDRTSHNALSTFIGSFTFALVGIIALSTGYYEDEGRTILFLGTLIVIVVIVVTLLRWISHLTTFGRMADVIDRVEEAATRALVASAEKPTLGALPLSAPHAFDAGPGVHASEPGYVTFVNVEALERVASDADVRLRIVALPGRFADATTPLVRVEGAVTDELTEAIRGAFDLGSHRTYEQDPRIGVIALAEIASRALSPSTHDPGTAIEVIGALQRVFTAALTTEPDDETSCERVFAPPVPLSDLLEDAYRPVARDGAGVVEVHLRLQRSLAALAALDPPHAAAFRAAADEAAARAKARLDPPDRATLRRVRARAWKH